MSQNTALLLGGYGNTGKLIARLLLQESDVQLVIAGRNRAKADSMAEELNRAFTGERVTGIALDAGDPTGLRHAFQKVDLVIVASSTSRYVREVCEAALECGIDYLDIQYSTKKIAVLKSLSSQIAEAGCCFITDGGFHPGLPAALVQYVAPCFDRLEIANVGSVMKQDWAGFDLPDDTVIELVEEMNDFVSLIYTHGAWKKVGMTSTQAYRSFDFGARFGKQTCMPMFLEEMRSLPEIIPTLTETGFFVGGFNTFVDWVILPLAMVCLNIWPRRAIKPVARMMKWGLIKFSKPPYGMVLKIEASGSIAGKTQSLEIALTHEDGYLFTAIPVVACLLQYLDGRIRKPGLWTQANLVEPDRFFHDMQRMGIEIQRGFTP